MADDHPESASPSKLPSPIATPATDPRPASSKSSHPPGTIVVPDSAAGNLVIPVSGAGVHLVSSKPYHPPGTIANNQPLSPMVEGSSSSLHQASESGPSRQTDGVGGESTLSSDGDANTGSSQHPPTLGMQSRVRSVVQFHTSKRSLIQPRVSSRIVGS